MFSRAIFLRVGADEQAEVDVELLFFLSISNSMEPIMKSACHPKNLIEASPYDVEWIILSGLPAFCCPSLSAFPKP
jgi:hypothetical protein